MANQLYPPILEKTLPAFYGDSITVPYTTNRAVNINTEVKGFSLIIRSTITNEVIEKVKTDKISNSSITFGIDGNNPDLFPGGFYKVQLAFIGEEKEKEVIGFYSNVSIVKYLGNTSPLIDIQDETTNNDMFIGLYQSPLDITEKMYSYCFSLYDGEGELIETSGEKLHNSTEDIGSIQRETFSPKISLDSGLNYTIIFELTTINDLHLTKKKNITAKKDDSGYKPSNITLKATMDEENGYMNIKIGSSANAVTKQLMYGKFVIFKTSSKDNYKQKYKIAYFSLENQDIFEKEFKDFTVEAGYSYRYILQQVNDWGIYSEEIYSGDPVPAYYEHLFLFDGIRQLKIKFNPKVSSFKNTILETKTDTIGGQYPFIFRNNNVKYKELNLSGLISYKMDEQNLFLNDSDIWTTVDEGFSAKDHWTHNLTNDNITAERIFKLKVLDWLNNGEVKLFKSPTEGNYIVRLLNVSLSPTDTVGRMLHTFTATGYEVEDVEKYQFCQALYIDKTNRYIGYRTTPLYDFPSFRIYNQQLNIDNTQYEIIGSPNLEFVVGVRFEDVKPRTQFRVTLERNGEVIEHSFYVGATGFYAIPSELGFHIKQIRLMKSSWDTQDYEFDIINNKGQVTYEFERQAKHNNFNDITAITSKTYISYPIYSTKITAKIEAPLTTIEGKSIYEYKAISNDAAYVEVGYFEESGIKKSNGEMEYFPWIRGVHYDVEEGQYFGKDGNLIHLLENDGYEYIEPSPKYIYQLTENPNSQTEKYQIISNNNPIFITKKDNTTGKIINAKGAILFLPKYDSKGVRLSDGDFKIKEKQNPYYTTCSIDETQENSLYADIYKMVPLVNTGQTNGFSNVGTETLYKNFVSNKYYNVTNVDEEYYIKEEIQNIYKLDFELIQIFYNEKLYEENKNQNLIDGTLSYNEIFENKGYSRTIRQIAGTSVGLDSAEEMYYDTITLIQPDFTMTNTNTMAKNDFITFEEFLDQWDNYYQLYNIPENTLPDISNLSDYKYLNKLTIYEQITSGTTGVFKYDLVTTIDESKIKNYYLNPKVQAYHRYIERTTPGYNEVIIVFNDDPNHIERIDLSKRLSYSIDAEALGQKDLQNIEAVYLGENVRGFMTYKSKRYSYNALLDNGLSLALSPEPDFKIIKENKQEV